MIYDWYKILSIPDFETAELPSREVTLELEGVGQKTILVTKVNLLSILYEGIFLSTDLNDRNPFTFEDHAVYVDANDDLFLGIGVPEEEEEA